MNELPNPLTPPDCDLRGLRWMPLDVVRVIDSDTFGLSTGDEFKTAFRLWAKSWLQVPAASLPDDDRLLAHLAGLSENMAKWKKVRAVALRGFVKCSDGRLYHPVIAEKAIEAMGRREEHAEREENTQSRQQRLRERRKAMFEQLRRHDIIPAWDTKTAELERLIASLGSPQPVTQIVTSATPSVTGSVTESVTGDVTRDAPATAIEKDRTGQDSKPKNLEALSPLQTEVGPSPGDIASPVSRSIEIAVYLRQRGIVGANSANPNIAGWGDDVRVTNEILDAALSIVASRKLDKPVGPNYLVGIITDLLNPKPAKASAPRFDDWHKSQVGIDRKARELGMTARGNESYDSFKERIWDELRKREQGGAAA